MPSGPLVQVFDSGTSWVRDAGRVAVLSDDAAESLRRNVVRDPIGLLIALHDRRLAVRRGPDVSIEGHLMPVLEVDLRTAGPTTLVIDRETGLIVRQRYAARGVSGEIEETFSDYRDVNGLQVAFSVIIRHPVEAPIRRVLRSFDYNVPIEPAIFARPGGQIGESLGIRPGLHPALLRCSSRKYSRYSWSSRLASRAHPRPRCYEGFSDRTTS
jgi:hypothetical protein